MTQRQFIAVFMMLVSIRCDQLHVPMAAAAIGLFACVVGFAEVIFAQRSAIKKEQDDDR